MYKARTFCTRMPCIFAVTNFYCDLAFVELFLKLVPHKLYRISFICLCMCLDKVYSQGSAISAIQSKWELLIWYEFLRWLLNILTYNKVSINKKKKKCTIGINCGNDFFVFYSHLQEFVFLIWGSNYLLEHSKLL